MGGPQAGQCESLHEVVTLAIEAAAIIAAQCALLALVLVLREPRLLIPAVIVGLPIEFFESEALDLLGRGGLTGAIRSLLNPGQLAMVATVIVGAIRVRHNPSRLFPNSRLIVPLTVLIGILLTGVLWSDSIIPSPSVITLLLYLAFIFVAPTLIEDRSDLQRIAIAFLIIAIPLSLIAMLQRLGIFNWRTILVGSDAFDYRSNATFADPNNLARFLVISMSLGVGLILTTGPNRTTVYLAIPALGLSLIALILTASRSGWLLLPILTFLVILIAPIARYTKVRLAVSGLAVLGFAVWFILGQGGANAERISSFGTGLAVIGQREFLIRGGWHMFTDHPLIGVGTGNFPNSLTYIYQDVVPLWARKTNLSHTSIVTIAAELGFLGLALVGFVMARTFAVLTRLYFSLAGNYDRFFVGWIGASLFGIFLVSQSEGRLFEEPYLWVLFAIAIAIESSPAFTRRPQRPRPAPAPHPAPGPRPAAPLAPAPLPSLGATAQAAPADSPEGAS